MSKYKISVIIPTYNSNEFLCSLFKSIKNQSMDFSEIQVIFVDDNSDEDYTINLLKSFDEEYENVKVVFSDENDGFPGKGRNIGLDLSDGEYVIFSDHDDSYADDAFERMYDVAADEDADMLIANYYKVFPDKKVKVKTIFNGKNIIVNNFEEDLRLFYIDPAIWTKLFKKKFLIDNNIRFLETMLAEDLFVYIASLVKSKSSVYLDDFYAYNYSIRNTDGDKSTIHIRNKKYLHKMVEGYYQVDKFLKDMGLERYFSDVFNRHFVYWISSLRDSKISFNQKVELIEFASPLLKKQLKIKPGFGERLYQILTKPILEDDYEKTVKYLSLIGKYHFASSKIKNILR